MPGYNGVGDSNVSKTKALHANIHNKFIDDVTSNPLACNGPPDSRFTSPSAKLIVQARETVSDAWLHTLTSMEHLR